MAAVLRTPSVGLTSFDRSPSGSVPGPSKGRALHYTPLHRTFGAKVDGADFSDVDLDLVEEIKEGLAKVRPGEGA